MAREFLRADNLCVRFPVKKGFFFSSSEVLHVLEGISLTVNKGESVGLVGESGCGKSTLAKALTGLVLPTSGEILLEGVSVSSRSIAKRRKAAKKVQMVFQDPASSLNPRKTVEQAFCDVLLFHFVSSNKEEAVKEATRLLEIVGLSEKYFARYPHEMSGGQLQRVAIALALAPRPELIIFDEATSSLDVSVQAQILKLLTELKKRISLSYLFISHDLAVVRNVCDRTYVLYLGKIMEVGGENLFLSPKHPYTEALVRAQPKMFPDEQRSSLGLRSFEPPSLIHPPSGCVFRTRCPYAQPICALPPPEKRSGGSVYYCILDR